MSTFTTPVARVVTGDPMHKHPATDDNNQPIMIKTGANAGQPREDYYIGVAVPKNPGIDWKQEPWGQVIVAAAHAGFPHLVDAAGNLLNPNMPVAFKVTDGDSPHPNKAGAIPNQKEGHPGHWIINAKSSGAMARLYTWDAQQGKAVPLPVEDQIKRGYFVQLNASVESNGSAQQPGVYINPEMLCRIAYGPEIASGPNVDEAGFGFSGQLPPGASMTPMGGTPATTTPATTPPATTTPATTPPVTPAHDLAQGPGAVTPPPVVDNTPPPPPADPILVYQGQERPRSQWLAMPGWTEQMVNQHCTPKA